ncbi:hypothetical protein COB18_01165 [Candidatus Kaiserbacteria bacterium]|nr:MAG: hypothetical protein COB18_01165 [Candidatus Kaiserbacteria bacterium]
MEGREVMSAIVGSIIDPIVLLIFSAGVFMFTWGLLEFLLKVDSPEDRKKGVQHMLWGIIGIFIMATVFGILNIITETLGLGDPTKLGL